MKMVLGLLVCLAFSGGVFAADDIAKAPCKADMEKLCVGIEPGDGRMMKCMADNEDKLSAECKSKRAEMKDKMADAREACDADIQKFCADVKGGKGRIMKCLKKHSAELSPACKESAPHKMKRK